MSSPFCRPGIQSRGARGGDQHRPTREAGTPPGQPLVDAGPQVPGSLTSFRAGHRRTRTVVAIAPARARPAPRRSPSGQNRRCPPAPAMGCVRSRRGTHPRFLGGGGGVPLLRTPFKVSGPAWATQPVSPRSARAARTSPGAGPGVPMGGSPRGHARSLRRGLIWREVGMLPQIGHQHLGEQFGHRLDEDGRPGRCSHARSRRLHGPVHGHRSPSLAQPRR